MAQRRTVPAYEGDLAALTDEQLVLKAHEYLVPGTTCFPRAIASEILVRVGEAGLHGGVVDYIDAILIGVAVRRIVGNYGDDDAPPDAWKTQFEFGLKFNPNREGATAELRQLLS